MKLNIFLLVIVMVFTVGCGSSEPSLPDKKIFAYIGDTQLNRILKIDPSEMKVVDEYYTEGNVAYAAERAGITDKVYAMTRGSNSIEVLNVETLDLIQKIKLEHYPRSSSFNEILGLQIVSGKDKPMVSVIDVETDTVVGVVGENREANVTNNFGGSNATGHPFWLSPDKFALLDRENRLIILYKIEKNVNSWIISQLDVLHTPTSIHHIIGKGLDGMNGGIAVGDQVKTLFHAVAEGSREEFISPRLLEIKLEDDTLAITRITPLKEVTDMGAHHATYHPDGKHIYLPSAEGTLYIIDKEDMSIKSEVKTGEGSAHVTFIPAKNIAVIINHMDTFITVVNSQTHKKIKDITISGAAIGTTILQSHTSFADKKQNYFYAFATDNGYMYQLDLSTLEVSNKLYTGGNPTQGDVF